MPASSASSPPPRTARSSALYHSVARGPVIGPVIVTVLGAVVFGVYWVTLRAPFVFDDLHFILGNPGFQDQLSLDKLLSDGLQETRPLYQLSLAANFAAGGTDVFGYHLINIVLHILCVALLYQLARVLRQDLAGDQSSSLPGAPKSPGSPGSTGSPGLPGFPEIAAALFALHPLTTESVAYVSARPGVMATFFGLAGLLLYLRHDRTRKLAVFLAAVACMVAAMTCKESAVSFPAIAAAYVFIIRGQCGFSSLAGRGRWLALVALLATAGVVPLLYLVAANPHAHGVGGEVLPLGEHYLTQVRVIAFFVLLSLAPISNNFDYEPPVSRGLDGYVAGAGALLLALVWLAWFSRRRAPIACLAVVWFLLAIAPTNPGVPFANFMAERYLYAGLMGAALGVAWVLAHALHRVRTTAAGRFAVAAVAVALVLAFAFRTAARNVVLADPLSLWTETAQQSPGKPRPLINLGVLYSQAGKYQDGHAVLVQAVQVGPEDPDAHYNLGVLYERTRRLPEALRSFRNAAELSDKPLHWNAFANVANKLAIASYQQNQLDRAESFLRQAIAVAEPTARYHFNLGVVLEAAGREQEARAELKRALALDPGHERARQRLEGLGGRAREPP